MTKEVIMTGRYRRDENSLPQRMKLIYTRDHRARNPEDAAPKLKLYDGSNTPIATYRLFGTPSNTFEDLSDPEFLRAGLKDLSRVLSDSGVFPPGFFEKLDSRLKENNWYREGK